MTKVSNPKLLLKQTKRTLVQLIIDLRHKIEQMNTQLHSVNLKLQQTRVELADLRNSSTAIKKGTATKTRSLKQTIKRRRKVVRHG